jgi:hypothetical protein
MTDISVETTAYQTERRSWLIPQPGGIGHGYTPSGTLDLSLFTAGTHYPNGYLPSGIALGRVTSTKVLGPYDPAASDGRQKCVGGLFASVAVRSATAKVGCAFVAAFAVIKLPRLPFQSGTGSFDAAAQTALPSIYFEA